MSVTERDFENLLEASHLQWRFLGPYKAECQSSPFVVAYSPKEDEDPWTVSFDCFLFQGESLHAALKAASRTIEAVHSDLESACWAAKP